jgi:predicted secreted protein
VDVRAQGTQGCRHQFHEALVTDGVGKLAPQLPQHIRQLVGCAITKAHLVKMNTDGHDFTHGEVASAPTSTLRIVTHGLLPVRQKRGAERIDMAEQCEYTHG